MHRRRPILPPSMEDRPSPPLLMGRSPAGRAEGNRGDPAALLSGGSEGLRVLHSATRWDR